LTLRTLLVGLIVVATVGFVIGTTIERHNAHHESAAQLRSESSGTHAAETGGETPASHAAELGAESPSTHAAEGAGTETEQHNELRPLGVDIEAVPFVVLAALASLALAGLGWARPRWGPGLAAIAVAMLVFGALDIREAFHQSDENQTGLVILAIAIAALHFAAAAVAATMAARSAAAGAARAGTMPA
jgi:hypothetical protein